MIVSSRARPIQVLSSTRSIVGVACVALFALMFGIKLALSADGMPAIGTKAPDFSLPSQDGSLVSLTDFRGKWVVLYFYPRDNTPGCTIEAHNFQRDVASYESENAVVVGISLDSAASHKGFCSKQGLTFKLLADTGKNVCQDYGSLRSILGIKMAARNTFLISPAGQIAKLWAGVSPAEHSKQVLAALHQLKTR